MKPQKQKKIIGMLERFDLPNQLAAVAGIASVGIMIISSGLSQQQPDFSSEETPYPYKFDGTAQGSSEVTVTPNQASTARASTTVTKESRTPSETSALSSAALTTTTTDSATPSSKALISPDSTTGLSITTKPTRFIEFPQTLTESKRALTATVRAIPSSQTVIPPSNTTVLSSTTASSRFLPTASTTASSRFLPVTSNTNIGHRLSTPPSSITLPSTAFIRPSSMAMVNGVVAPSRLANAPNSTTSPSSSITTPLNWFPAKVRPTERTLVAANSSSTRKGVYLQQAIDDANATAFGLVVAMHKGEINLHSSTWRKAQDAIILLRQGKTRQEAASQAGIPMSVLVQLLEWGKNRPGASSRVVET
ncbi:MAG: hypothetical protein JO235_26470, partial [Chroococcidiopsidaceae cyanobacterium CP_BM_RX_35]|nr:hypothetical protein [Chroococcidiopsidaceae cyanobacterium CP_BM_RX_35]